MEAEISNMVLYKSYLLRKILTFKLLGILHGLHVILYWSILVVKQWKELSQNCNVLHFSTIVSVSLAMELWPFPFETCVA